MGFLSILPLDKTNKIWPWSEEVDTNIYLSRANWPKITIVTPSFNQGEFIEETILSIINQGYPNLEYIIIDGGSNDNTVEIIEKYSDKIACWISEPDRGQTDAINKGFRKATGDILTWIASDDYLEKGALYYIANLYLDNGFELINGNCYVIEEGKSTIPVVSGKVDLARLIRFWRPYFIPPQPSIFFTKEVWQTCGPLDEDLKYSMDLQLWLRAAQKFRFTYVDKYLSYYRFHSNSKSASSNGFEKFKPEWEHVIISYIKYEFKLIERIKFIKEYSFYKDRPTNRLFHSISFLKYYLNTF